MDASRAPRSCAPSSPHSASVNTRRVTRGYVTADDEHEGRGPAIRTARRTGLHRARRRRLAYHRAHRQDTP